MLATKNGHGLGPGNILPVILALVAFCETARAQDTKERPQVTGLAVWFCVALFLSLTIPGQAQQQPQVLHSHVRPPVASRQAVRVGFLPPTQRLNLVIHLPVRNQDELSSLIDRLSDPTSPDYRHWLSVAEFTEGFGRTEAEYQKVADFAEANGFAVTYRSPNRLMLVVRGSVAQIEKAFNVEIRTYQHPAENRVFYSPDREPSFALDVPVSHISGLEQLLLPASRGRTASSGTGRAQSHRRSWRHGHRYRSELGVPRQ
jgi:subtilase family serine protease